MVVYIDLGNWRVTVGSGEYWMNRRAIFEEIITARGLMRHIDMARYMISSPEALRSFD